MYSLEIDHIPQPAGVYQDRRSVWLEENIKINLVHFTIFYRTKFYFVWPNMQDWWWVVLGVQLPMHAEDFLATPLDQC